MILADKIIDLRKKAGWSQEELAEKLAVTRQSVSKWEGAQSIPDMDKVPVFHVVQILIRFWQCECYGQIVEWLSNDMKYDIQAQFSRLCTFYRGGFEAMARQDADTGIPC